MFRKRLALFLSLAMVLTSVPVTPTFATETATEITTEATTEATTEKATETTEKASEATTDKASEATTEKTSETTTETLEKAANDEAPEGSTEEAPEGSTEDAPEQSTQDAQQPTTEAPTVPTTEAPQAPTTEASTPTEAREFYYMDYEFPNNTNSVLLNEEVTISTKLHHQYTDDDGRGHNEEITGYTIALDTKKGNLSEICTLTSENNNIKLTMLQEGEHHIPLKAIISESEGKTIEVSLNMDVHAANSYYFIETPDFDANWPMGRTDDFQIKLKEVTQQNSTPQVVEGEIYSFNIQHDGGDDYSQTMRFQIEDSPMHSDDWAPSNSSINLTRDMSDEHRVTIIAGMKKEDGEGYTELCRKDLVFNDVHLDLSFTGLNDGSDCWVYEDGSITITPEITPEINLSNYTNDEKNRMQYSWKFKKEGTEEISLNPTVGSNRSITLYGSELKGHITKDQYIEASLEINFGAATIAKNSFKVRIQESEVNYGFPWDENVIVLKEMEFNIDDFSAYIRSSEYPDGEDIPCFIQDVQSSNENVCTFTKDGNFAPWKATFNDLGQATITVKFIRFDEVEDETTFTINVVDKMLFVDFNYPNDCQSILKGQSIDINTSVRAEWESEEDGHDSEDVEDYALEILEYDSDLIQAQVAGDGHTLHVTSNGDGGYANITLKATCEVQIGSETHELERVVKTGVDVRDDYYYMYSDFDTNMMIGKRSETTFGARHVYLEDGNKMEEEITDTLSYNIQFSEDNFAVAVNEDGSGIKGDNTDFNGTVGDLVLYLTRKNKESCDFRISASLENDEEICNRTFFTNYLDNQIEFDGLRDGDHTWIFNDEKMTIKAAAPVVGEYDDNYIMWMWKICSYEYGNDNSEEEITGCYQAMKDKITIDGTKFPSIDSEKKFCRVSVSIYYMDSGNRYTLAEADFGIDLEESNNERLSFEDKECVCGRGDFVDKYYTIYQKNATYPYGKELDCQVTDVEVDEEYCSIEEQDNGWNIFAKKYGETEVTVTYTMEGVEEPQTASYKMDIKADVLYTTVEHEEDTNQMLPDADKVVGVSVEHDWKHEGDEEPGYEKLANFTLTVESVSDEDILTAEVSEDGKSIIVHSKENVTGESEIVYKVSYTVNAGTEDEYIIEKTDCFTMLVDNSYYYMSDLDVDPDLKVGQSVQVSPKLYVKTAEGSEEIDSYNIRVNYSENQFEIKDSAGNVVESDSGIDKADANFTIKRIDCGDDGITFTAEVYNPEVENYEFAAERTISFNGKWYVIWAEDAGDEDDAILKDCDFLTVKLNSDIFDDYTAEEVTWNYGLYKTENDEKISNGYTGTQNGSITLDGAVLKQYGKSFYASLSLQVGDCVLASAWFGIRLEAHQHTYSSSFTVDVPATTSQEGSQSKHCTARGCDSKTEVTAIPKVEVPTTPPTIVTPAVVAPAGTAFTKATNTKGKKVTLKWKKVTGINGYQVRYVTGKSTKMVTLKATATSKVISKLTKKKVYQFSIRTYKTVDGVNYYSNWSAVKKIKIKK